MRRKRDAPQDEDLELGFYPRDEVPGGGREAAVSKDEVKLTHHPARLSLDRP
jgi:hypothetical protein